MDVAGKSLALRALRVTEETYICSEAEGVHVGSRRALEGERIDRMRAIRYVIETGLPYRPLIDKWQRRGK
jgi:hypothetical protein